MGNVHEMRYDDDDIDTINVLKCLIGLATIIEMFIGTRANWMRVSFFLLFDAWHAVQGQWRTLIFKLTDGVRLSIRQVPCAPLKPGVGIWSVAVGIFRSLLVSFVWCQHKRFDPGRKSKLGNPVVNVCVNPRKVVGYSLSTFCDRSSSMQIGRTVHGFSLLQHERGCVFSILDRSYHLQAAWDKRQARSMLPRLSPSQEICIVDTRRSDASITHVAAESKKED